MGSDLRGYVSGPNGQPVSESQLRAWEARKLKAAERVVELVRSFDCCDGEGAARTDGCCSALAAYDAAKVWP